MPAGRVDEARLAFDKAFPRFDYRRWFWSFDLEEKSHSGYRRPMASATAKGELVLHMPDAPFEEFAAVRQWLIDRFEPAYLAPAATSSSPAQAQWPEARRSRRAAHRE